MPLLHEGRGDGYHVLVFARVHVAAQGGFRDAHEALLRTHNPLERLTREIRRRTRVVGAFLDGPSALMRSGPTVPCREHEVGDAALHVLFVCQTAS